MTLEPGSATGVSATTAGACGDEQATNSAAAKMTTGAIRPYAWNIMGLILLEALLALAIAVFIVWWTMFSGRKKEDRTRDDDPAS